ncbi:MAG: hypothetical protein CM1200mP3_03710 [Chloroflexota bacterium]|nr:MAG: hypothetical protein CM1200mP3_03710 [Chloroflexota bacterium]
MKSWRWNSGTQTYLYQYFDYDMGPDVLGISSILKQLRFHLARWVQLGVPTDDQFKLVVHSLFLINLQKD